MDTKKIQLQGSSKKKAGLNNTQTILTAAGAAIAGAVGGAALNNSTQETEIPVEPYAEGTSADETEMQNEELTAQQQTDNGQSSQEATAGNTENISQPQPTDSSQQPQTAEGTQGTQGTQASQNTTAQNTTAQNSQNTDSPEQIAENIIGTEEIDNEDIDAPSVIAIDGLTTVFNENGYEVQAAVVHTPDGTQYILADSDGDGVFEGVYDMSGNYVTNAEAQITQSDLETMIDQTGGFLAINDSDKITSNGDPTNDIIDTETGEHVDIAQYVSENSQAEESETSPDTDLDDLLAQLLDSDDDSANEEEIYNTDDSGTDEADEEDSQDTDDSQDYENA